MRIPAFARTALKALVLAFAVVEPCFAASGSFADTAASYLAVFIIIVVPIAGIVLFWLVHVLPEKIAEKRHHPQKDAIHVLCLLSLVFGGLLWPLAWLWAYSKPVLHQLAYGRDKHEDYFAEREGEGGDEAKDESVQKELGRLRHDLELLEKRGELPASMKGIRERVAALEGRAGSAATAGGDG